ncbi:hypothetical protein ACLB2K_060194 [Fragaria x ananassa]
MDWDDLQEKLTASHERLAAIHKRSVERVAAICKRQAERAAREAAEENKKALKCLNVKPIVDEHVLAKKIELSSSQFNGEDFPLDEPMSEEPEVEVAEIMGNHPISKIGVELEIGYDYSEGSGTGPDHWGELRKEWKACKDEKLQSPINLLDELARKAVSRVYDLKMNYKPSNATMMNEGHAISLEWEGDAGSIQINGTDYFLKQCHWHRSSEHFINGIRYDLELHMVHRSRNNGVAVVAYLYQTGKRSPFLAKVS